MTVLTFSDALTHLKKGGLISRRHWSHRGKFIFMQVPANINVEEIVPKMQSLPQDAKDKFTERLKQYQDCNNLELKNNLKYSTHIHYKNQIAVVNYRNEIFNWTPRVEDILADDWVIL